MMQHKKDDFAFRIPVAHYDKLERAAQDTKIRIDRLSMASRSTTERIASDYPNLKAAWYCLRVDANCEFAVEKRLTDSDVATLVVKSSPSKIVRRGRVRMVPARPVIVGYVLVHCLPIPSAIMGLLGVKGVNGVVGGAVSPWRADAESINRFRAMADAGKYDHRVPAKYDFMVDEEVRVSDGPFASFHGTVRAVDFEKFRVKVDVMIFGRLTPVDLDIAQIEKV